MTSRTRIIGFVVVCALAVVASSAYILQSRSRQAEAVREAPQADETPVAVVEREPRIVFRHTGLGHDYGKVAMVALGDPDGPRAVTKQLCDRVYATDGRRLCLGSDRGLITTYAATVTGRGGVVDLPLPGTPSRARLSPDGRLAATTSFVTGDSYAAANFSTRTLVSDLEAGTDSNLEDFQLIHRGTAVRPTDRNYWGVTFSREDGDLFYATVAWGGRTWLVEGSLQERRMTTIRSDAECPSLSPDGTQLVYKKRGDLPPGQWRLAGLDLASGREVLLSETRSVDDQVEWLDNSHVVYGIPRAGDDAATSDIYSVPVDGTGKPELLIEQAWSAAVIR